MVIFAIPNNKNNSNMKTENNTITDVKNVEVEETKKELSLMTILWQDFLAVIWLLSAVFALAMVPDRLDIFFGWLAVSYIIFKLKIIDIDKME